MSCTARGVAAETEIRSTRICGPAEPRWRSPDRSCSGVGEGLNDASTLPSGVCSNGRCLAARGLVTARLREISADEGTCAVGLRWLRAVIVPGSPAEYARSRARLKVASPRTVGVEPGKHHDRGAPLTVVNHPPAMILPSGWTTAVEAA